MLWRLRIHQIGFTCASLHEYLFTPRAACRANAAKGRVLCGKEWQARPPGRSSSQPRSHRGANGAEFRKEPEFQRFVQIRHAARPARAALVPDDPLDRVHLTEAP